MLRDNWPVIDWREPIGLQERLEGRSSHNGEISVMSRDSLKGNTEEEIHSLFALHPTHIMTFFFNLRLSALI